MEKKKIKIKIKKDLAKPASADPEPIHSDALNTVKKAESEKKEKTVSADGKEKKVKSAKTTHASDLFDDKKPKKEYNLEIPDLSALLAQEMNLRPIQIKNTISMLDEGNTIPFIARYRKEATGSLDEVVLRDIDKRVQYLRSLYQRKKEVLSSILSQDKLTKELEEKILKADKLSVVEELYLPYKPKRKTKGVKAKELGLEPLAIKIKTENDPHAFAGEFVDPEKGINNEEDALKIASYIVMEEFAEHFEVRNTLKDYLKNFGELDVKKKNPEESDEFDMYKEYKEPVKSIKNHRILAINRGEKKEKLAAKIIVSDDDAFDRIYSLYIKKEQYTDNSYLKNSCLESYKKSLFSSIENMVRNEMTISAEKEAIEVFALNLHDLLMMAPLKNKKIMAIDPGIRTGSKIAILNEYGDYTSYSLIYQEEALKSMNTITDLIEKNDIELIAIGNGTASREVEALVARTIKEKNLSCKYLIIAETGASVYSASETAREEFPDLDVTVRGAISIGRRVLDPLSEFVKIDPKSLGVGQYQHDVNQKQLGEKLDEVVEDCVNHVGVLLNTASASLLKYVSGISASLAKSIVNYRIEHGPFKARDELLKVPGFGAKTYEQAAGFLRIPESKNFLDNSWIHPESYEIAHQIIKMQKEGKSLDEKSKKELAEKFGKGQETINDIISDIKKPGRDPRDDIEKPILKDDILSIDDIFPGLKLKGTIRNVTKFGAFVDIGLKNDALVHVSEISDEFVDDPLSKVHIGQIVDVKVIDVDKERKRVSLSMKTGERPNRKTQKPQQPKQQNFDDNSLGNLLKNIKL